MKSSNTVRLFNIYLTLSIFISIFACIGCKEENEETDKTYTITGKVVTSCDNPVPVANLPFELWYYSDSKRDSKQHATGVTDENGGFNISYSHTPNGFNSTLSIITANGPFGQKTLLANIPQNKNIISDIYTDTNYFVIIKISTVQQYTNSDTLFYYSGSFVANEKFIRGPFYNNQIIDTLVFSSVQGWSKTNQSGQGVSYFNRWLIGKKYFDPKRQNEIYTLIEPCKKYNEVVLDLTKAIE
jgi:hypothetical protein